LRRQIWCTLWCEIPTAAAMLRVLHFFFPLGGCVTRVITCRTFSGGSHDLRPRPFSSFSPSKPPLSKRFDQSETVLVLVPTIFATSASFLPWDRSKTIRARRASRWVAVEETVRRRSSDRSSGVNSRRVIGRAMSVVWHAIAIITSYFEYTTLGFEQPQNHSSTLLFLVTQ